MKSRLPLAFLLAIVSASALRAQTVLSGTVLTNDAYPVEGAFVFVGAKPHCLITDSTGRFSVEGLAAGEHRVVVRMDGQAILDQTVELSEGEHEDMNVQCPYGHSDLEPVVVTASRTRELGGSVPVPVTVISGAQVKRMGSQRLDQVLAEQTGLQIISEHGAGLQMQGMSSDYILILVDGEPLVGRTAGTMDLSRVAVGNIERIEIVRGPSSSLYGSDALAGVVNIITRKSKNDLNARLGAQHRSYKTWQTYGEVGLRRGNWNVGLFFDRLQSGGYDLTPEEVSQTVAPSAAFTIAPKVSYQFSENSELRISSRFYRVRATDRFDTEERRVETFAEQNEANVNATFSHQLGQRGKVQLRQYWMRYHTHENYDYEDDGTQYDASFFSQQFMRSEAQADYDIAGKHTSTLGVGRLGESVEATRYDELTRFTSQYVFFQQQWRPGDKDRWNLQLGGRYDMHSAFASRFSPKAGLWFRATNWMRLRASVGAGYKTPDFRTLLLNFSNPIVGYSVFGSLVVDDKVAELQSQGQIASIQRDPASFSEVKPERSLGFNAGYQVDFSKKVRWTMNLYHNEIKELIETQIVATKTNGQYVYSYTNLNNIYTQGLETDLRVGLPAGFEISGGYAYTVAKDRDVVERIENGEVYASDPGDPFADPTLVRPADYGGLNNRSKHSGNLKLNYWHHKAKVGGFLRVIYRGRFGSGVDVNANSILDDDREYAASYWLWNLAVDKTLLEQFTLRAGIDNLMDRTNAFVPTMPGRVYFVAFEWNLSKSLGKRVTPPTNP